MTATYRRLPTDSSNRRAYTITVGLQIGYDVAPAVPKSIARNIVLDWIARRIVEKKPFLTFRMTHCDLLYGWAAEDGFPQTVSEPGLFLDGDVSVLHGAHIRDGEIMEMLDDVAERLGAALKQTRVYLTYRATAWVLEREEETP